MAQPQIIETGPQGKPDYEIPISMLPVTDACVPCSDPSHRGSSYACKDEQKIVIHRPRADSSVMVHRGGVFPSQCGPKFPFEAAHEIYSVINLWGAKQDLESARAIEGPYRQQLVEGAEEAVKDGEDMLEALRKYAEPLLVPNSKPARPKKMKVKAPVMKAAEPIYPTSKVREATAQSEHTKGPGVFKVIEVSKDAAPVLHFTSPISTKNTLEEEQAKADKFLKDAGAVRNAAVLASAKARDEVLKEKLGEVAAAVPTMPSIEAEEKTATEAPKTWTALPGKAKDVSVGAAESTTAHANEQAAPQKKDNPTVDAAQPKTGSKPTPKPTETKPIQKPVIKKAMLAEKATPKKIEGGEDWEAIDAEEVAEDEYVFI